MLVWHQLSHFLRRVRSCIRYCYEWLTSFYGAPQSDEFAEVFIFYPSFYFHFTDFSRKNTVQGSFYIFYYLQFKSTDGVIHVLAGLLALESQKLTSKVEETN